MKKSFLFCLISLISTATWCQDDGFNPSEKKIEVDTSKHFGLNQLRANSNKILYSVGQREEAKKQASLIEEAYGFLSGIMGQKKEFYLLVLSEADWERNAYSPVPGMPEYYKGNLIVGAAHNSMATGYEEMIEGFPKKMTTALYVTYSNSVGELDMKLFFDKLSVHELTHNFQDPRNDGGFSMSRWLEEIHANMGLYAFYKSKRREELKYITTLVDFSLDNPPPNIKYQSLSDFDAHYYEMGPGNYGFYQMKFTKASQMIIDSLGNDILKPLNDFIIKYDQSWKERLNDKEFKAKLAHEVHPYFMEIINNLY